MYNSLLQFHRREEGFCKKYCHQYTGGVKLIVIVENPKSSLLDQKVSTAVLHVTKVGLNVTNINLLCSFISDTATFFQV